MYPVVDRIYIWKPPTTHIHSAFTGPETGVPLVKPIGSMQQRIYDINVSSTVVLQHKFNKWILQNDYEWIFAIFCNIVYIYMIDIQRCIVFFFSRLEAEMTWSEELAPKKHLPG